MIAQPGALQTAAAPSIAAVRGGRRRLLPSRVRLSRKSGAVRRVQDHLVMGQSFIACDREQSFLMPPDVREWLPEGHLAWFVIDAVAEMDLHSFYAYRQDGRSRPAYDPSMMVALVLYAYARGVRSGRAIERACEEDVAFRVIAAQQAPDHATIARFVERHEQALAGLFGSVLALCAQAGLARVWTIPSLTETGLCGFRSQEMRSKGEERSTVSVIA
jgi:transposase